MKKWETYNCTKDKSLLGYCSMSQTAKPKEAMDQSSGRGLLCEQAPPRHNLVEVARFTRRNPQILSHKLWHFCTARAAASDC